MKKILIATGGTGGHIYPALITAEELRRRGHEILFIGVFGAVEEKLKADGFRHVSIPARGFVAKGFADKLRAIGGLFSATGICAVTIRSFRPDVIIGFGGYSSFPAVFMGWLLCCRTMIHEQNVVPGVANRILSVIVRRICVGFKDSLAFFPKGKTAWTGTPFRPLSVDIGRAAAAQKFGLDPSKKIILVFGGSQGARQINRTFLEFMLKSGRTRGLQVIHATGRNDLSEVEAQYAALGQSACVRAFIENIDEAYAACDLVVARAGAGTVTELAALGLPAVLIPYPGARDHQLMNARVLERAGTASIIEEKSLSSDILGANIFDMISLRASRRNFSETLSSEFIADPAVRLADEIERFRQG